MIMLSLCGVSFRGRCGLTFSGRSGLKKSVPYGVMAENTGNGIRCVVPCSAALY